MKDYRFAIEDRKNYIYVRFAKVPLTIEILLDALNQELLIDNKRFLNNIWNIRNVDSTRDIDFTKLSRFVNTLNDPGYKKWQRKTAIVVETEAVFGVSRMYQSLAAVLPFEVEVFDNEDKALEWLLI